MEISDEEKNSGISYRCSSPYYLSVCVWSLLSVASFLTAFLVLTFFLRKCIYTVYNSEPILTATVMSSMAAMCTTQAFAATGEVDTSSFISTACTVLKSVICLIGAGVGVWGVVNLLEGYGNDNPGAKAQ